MTTLFSYFGKKTKPDKSPKTINAIPLLKDANNSKSTDAPSEVTPRSDVLVEEGSIVWAKLGDHPWWPSMICSHPTTKTFFKKDLVHVQFFGSPPSRSWVKKQNICNINEDHSARRDDVQEALEESRRAIKLDKKERIQKLYACIPSDEEMEEMSDNEKRGKANGISMKRSRELASSDEEEEQSLQGARKTPRRKSMINGTKKLKKRAKWSIGSGSEDSGDDKDNYKPTDSEDSEDDASSGVEETIESEDNPEEDSEDSDIGVKTKASKRKANGSVSSQRKVGGSGANRKSPPSSTPVTPKSSILSSKLSNSVVKAQISLSKFSAMTSPAPNNSTSVEEETFSHQKLKFLQDGNRKDKHGRLHTDPNYDQRSLLVPETYLKSKEVTPGMRQWWMLKKDNFDTVLFFKVGKFYELYHMDATIGVKELGLLYMRGNFAHAGFPEIAFSRYSDLLIQKGYKVARVEQTETPQMLSERCASGSIKEKVVRREICAIISKGTKTFSFMEGDSTDHDSSYLLAVCERPSEGSSMFSTLLGVCFVDTSIGKFHLGQFKDDKQCSRFRTLISHYQPVQVLFEKNSLSAKLQHVLTHELTTCLKEPLSQESNYFSDSATKAGVSEEGKEQMQMPQVIRKMLSDYDSLGLTASDDYHLAISSLGACIWYLKKCCIEEELLSMGQFEEFVPLDNMSKAVRSSQFPVKGQHMILDAVTLKNLDVVINGDGGLDGTLLQQLDHCSTPFGKRLLKQWICAPLCNHAGINDRLDAIDDLCKLPSVMSECRELLKTLPDFERLLRRIHSLGSLRKSQDHPDSRAILYNEEVYGKRKIADLLSAIEGFDKSVAVKDLFKHHGKSLKSKLLQQVTLMNSPDSDVRGRFPDLAKNISFFKTGFDHSKAKKDGVVIPEKGVHAAYDDSMNEIDTIKGQLDSYLAKQKKMLGCSGIEDSLYVFTHGVHEAKEGKTRYQLEVPEVALKNNTPNHYHLKSQKKGYKRYWTDEIEEMVHSLEDAEERRDAALKDTMRNIFNQFDKYRKTWKEAVECIAVLDCLMSLAFYRSHVGGSLCRPQVMIPNQDDDSERTKKTIKADAKHKSKVIIKTLLDRSCDDIDSSITNLWSYAGALFQPFMEILNSRHPCISRTFSGGDFIPNDIIIGTSNPEVEDDSGRCVIVTGPNMGGKSTLMRQAGVITIMAQLGSYVPADECKLTPCDRIFTRLGAQDRILQGESTFFVELSETSSILQHATEHSLVLLDELGRGTATYDGTAIASAVIEELADSLKCRTLFSTHYHSLVDDLSADPRVKLGHMACMVENDNGNEDNDDPSQETITFLYRFIDGSCPKSYGFNAAKLAGIPLPVIKNACRKAKEFEQATKKSRLLRKIFCSDEIKDRDMVEIWLGKAGLA